MFEFSNQSIRMWRQGLPKENNAMKVKNINGTSDNTCACGSWLDHWKIISRQPIPKFCPEENCVQKPEAGAHIQKDNSADDSWYIVPLCKIHNNAQGRSLKITDTIQLVPANVSITCGKK
jgi:hypothetical protein